MSKEFTDTSYDCLHLERQMEGQPQAANPLVVRIWKRLRQTDEKYRRIFENAVVGIFQATTQGHFLMANPTLASIYGYESPQDMTDAVTNLKESLYVDPNQHKELMRALYEQQAVWRFESEVYRQDGSKIWISENVRLLYDSNNRVVGYEGTVEDITEPKQAEATLNEALEKAKEFSELNSHFASIVSHELRNSLTVILVSTDLLRLHSQKMSTEEKLKRLDKIRSAVKNMTELLEGVLAIGRAESGKIKFEKVFIDLKAFFQEIWQEVQAMTKTKQTFRFVCQGGYVVTLATDLRLLRQIFINLMLNAVKYSPQGKRVECEFDCRGEEAAIFHIKDEGIGILPEDKEYLFEVFHRGRNASEFEGTGLGLAIVKKAVDLHGGWVSVESQVGVGTTFTVNLPRVQGEKNLTMQA